MNYFPLDSYNTYLFHEGTNYYSHFILGAHFVSGQQNSGVRFTVWAPQAAKVRVVGDFNNWQGHDMVKINDSGIWSVFIANVQEGDLYKYEIHTEKGERLLKADPYGFFAELRPKTASVVYKLHNYNWQDAEWQKKKRCQNLFQQPILIYEVHLGSWRRKENNSFLSYRELADQLINYVKDMGFTHIELMPITEHPLDESWGYQVTGYFAATSRFGSPRDLMYFIDQCHRQDIGVILDFVPGHFCLDAHGLAFFDGTPLYEHSNPLRRDNKQWGTANFDFTRPEVWSFLISSAVFWLEMFHIDGLRVDAVANMLYLDYAKQPGQWVSNIYGGNENIEAVAFLKKLNEVVFKHFPNTLMIAEESSQWPMVTQPTYVGGLGFNYKWNMGWMNDILEYMQLDSIHKKWHHNKLTFSFMYTYAENYILPLSHDEVVHEKKSLLSKMPGNYWEKFANLRLLYGYMYSHPGKKLLFMGGEFGQFNEWQCNQSLDWHLLNYDLHKKLHLYVRDLNHFYKAQRSLWELDHDRRGLTLIDANDCNQSVLTLLRQGKRADDFLIAVCNFTPIPRADYRIGVPALGNYREIFNSDAEKYGGTNYRNDTILAADNTPWHNQPYSLNIKLPPLAIVFLQPTN